MECGCDVDRTCIALLTALANDEKEIFRSLVDELAALEDPGHAIVHLAGFALGLLREHGDARQIMANLGPKLEGLR